MTKAPNDGAASGPKPQLAGASSGDDKSPGRGAQALHGAARPTDEELMLFVDDELEGDRYDVVAAFVASDATAKKKVEALRLAGALLRDAALTPGPADSIADSVMAEIARSNGVAKVVPLRAAPSERAGASKPAPANDNSRRIYMLLAGALAAAAALTMWARSDEQPSEQPPPVAIHAPMTPQLAVSAEPAAPNGEAEASGAEVAAVDFGTHGGTIFYVAGGAASSPTMAVVWLNDDAAGGQ